MFGFQKMKSDTNSFQSDVGFTMYVITISAYQTLKFKQYMQKNIQHKIQMGNIPMISKSSNEYSVLQKSHKADQSCGLVHIALKFYSIVQYFCITRKSYLIEFGVYYLYYIFWTIRTHQYTLIYKCHLIQDQCKDVRQTSKQIHVHKRE